MTYRNCPINNPGPVYLSGKTASRCNLLINAAEPP